MNARSQGWISYDWFKLVVATILALLLLWLSLTGWQAATVLPTAPVASQPAIDALRLTAPAPGAELPAGIVTFSGTGSPGSQVDVVVDGTSVGVATIGADGSWSLDATFDTPGQRSLILRALDSAGAAVPGVMPGASSFTVAWAAAQINAPTLDAPAAPISAGSFTLTGTGVPNGEVAVLVDGQQVGTASVGADGVWSLPADLSAGAREIVVQALDSAGAVAASAAALTINVQAAAASDTGTGGPSATAAPAITSLTNGATLDAGTITIGGTGAPGSTVEVLNGSTLLGAATVAADGTWSFDYDAATGMYALDVRPAGGAASGGAVTITVSEAAASGGTSAGGTAASGGTTTSGAANSGGTTTGSAADSGSTAASGGTAASGDTTTSGAAETPAQLPSTGGSDALLLVSAALGLMAAGLAARRIQHR